MNEADIAVCLGNDAEVELSFRRNATVFVFRTRIIRFEKNDYRLCRKIYDGNKNSIEKEHIVRECYATTSST